MITSVAGEAPVRREQDGLTWTVGCDCSGELLRLLSGDDAARVNILSRPQILALDGQSAAIQIGHLVPFVQGVTLVDGRATPNVQTEQFGIEVSLTPQLLDVDSARYEICLERTTQAGETAIFPDPAAGASYLVPVKHTTAMRATVELQSGGTLILALPPQDGETSQDNDSPPLLLFIGTPRVTEVD